TSYTLAMHELGHVLGFGHSAARNSVMWPRFGCLTNNVSEIVHDVKEIYKNYKPDLAVSSAAASMQGAAVKVEADIINEGPKLAENVTLAIYINGKQAHAEEAGDIDTGYALKATSLLPTRQRIDEIKVEARYDGDELTKENNVVVLKAE
ncbi:MAG: matrixin family metalloprotease, partial [Candidatus Aenigmarchaeota archaeon]|nr:matrixin family metalloprotease [Candidatus Aenigmarchaeota archaeon]